MSEPETVASIWQRELVARVDPSRLPRVSFENGQVLWFHDYREQSLEGLFHGLELGDNRAPILADVRFLLDRWFEIATVPHAFVSLSVIAHAGCQKLHIDRVGHRLLATYAGSATEWLDPDATGAWREDKCCFEPSQLRQLRAGDVLLMKGCTEGDESGLVHRAPPWAPQNEPRLLLRICDGEYHLHRQRLVTA